MSKNIVLADNIPSQPRGWKYIESTTKTALPIDENMLT